MVFVRHHHVADTFAFAAQWRAGELAITLPVVGNELTREVQNTAYDDLDDIQVEPRETSPSPQVHHLELDAFPNPSPELGVPGPPQRDSPPNHTFTRP